MEDCKLSVPVETLSLMFLDREMKANKNRMIGGMAAFGRDGEECYQRYFMLWEKYVRTFLRYRVNTGCDDYFSQGDMLMALLALLSPKGDLTGEDQLAQDDLRRAMYRAFTGVSRFSQDIIDTGGDIPDNQEQFARILDNSDFCDATRWKLYRMAAAPGESLAMINEAISLNREACIKAIHAVERPLDEQLSVFASAGMEKNAPFQALRRKIGPDAVLRPVLAEPMVQIMTGEYCYYGLLLDRVLGFGQDREEQLTALRARLRAMGDRTKWEILCALRSAPKYNTELAELLGVAPPTILHHMNILTACGLVEVEKTDGRVYYQAKLKQLQQLCEDLETNLLN